MLLRSAGLFHRLEGQLLSLKALSRAQSLRAFAAQLAAKGHPVQYRGQGHLLGSLLQAGPLKALHQAWPDLRLRRSPRTKRLCRRPLRQRSIPTRVRADIHSLLLTAVALTLVGLVLLLWRWFAIQTLPGG